MDRPKLAICAVEKAPPSFSPAFCRSLIGLPPIISPTERASEQPHLTICHCQPVGRTRTDGLLARRARARARLPARFASTQYLSAPASLQSRLQSGGGEDTDTRARARLFCEDSSARAGMALCNQQTTRRRYAHLPRSIWFLPPRKCFVWCIHRWRRSIFS